MPKYFNSFISILKLHSNPESAWHNFTAILKHPLLYIRVCTHVEGLIDHYTGSLLYETVLANRSDSHNIIEVVAYKGKSTIYLSLAAFKVNKRLISFELFSGLPCSDPVLDSGFRKGQFSSDINQYIANIATYGNSSAVDLMIGDARQTLLPKIVDNGFSVAFLDVDVYEVMKELLFQLWNIAKGNEIVIIHDINSPGVRKAVDELLVIAKNRVIETHFHRNTIAKLVILPQF